MQFVNYLLGMISNKRMEAPFISLRFDKQNHINMTVIYVDYDRHQQSNQIFILLSVLCLLVLNILTQCEAI